MTKLVSRLILLFALLAMPFGMAAAPAAAGHHGAAAAMPMSHCPEGESTPGDQGGVVKCMMPCAAALPTAELCTPEAQPIVRSPAVPTLAQRLRGLDPETATPPPKRS